MRMLRSRLVELAEEEREAELARERGAAQDIGFGSQIRSYVLHPYQLVKDHRTDFEIGNAQGVLDGDLDGFVRALPPRQGGGTGLPEPTEDSDARSGLPGERTPTGRGLASVRPAD